MAVSIKFVSLTGSIKIVRTETFPTQTEALAAVKVYAESAGFSNVKLAGDDNPCDGFRFTATPPGGRRGRNVAFGDWDD